MKQVKFTVVLILALVVLFALGCRARNAENTQHGNEPMYGYTRAGETVEEHSAMPMEENYRDEPVSAVNLLLPHEIDRNLYQRMTLRDRRITRRPGTIPDTIEYHKFDAVFVYARESDVAKQDHVFYVFFELNGEFQEGSGIMGPLGLPLPERGQFVTVYFREFPERSRSGGPLLIIDHIEIPSGRVADFEATHKTVSRVEITDGTFGRFNDTDVLFTLDAGVEIEVVAKNFMPNSNIEDGQGGLIPGQWKQFITADGFGGWVFSVFLEAVM